MFASYRYLGVSNPGLQMLESNECDVSYQYGTRASFQSIRRIPALYILRPKKNLRQLVSCQPSSQNEWSVDGWMCCQITTPGRSILKPKQHQTYSIEKVPRFVRNNPIMSWGHKISFKKIYQFIYSSIFLFIIFFNLWI